jgi:hypothetical protein
MNSALAAYRREIITPLMDSLSVVTPKSRQKALMATVRFWGIDPDVEKDNPVKLQSAMTAAGLLVQQQAPHCLSRIEKQDATEHQLELLNLTYEIDGLRSRLGDMTPKQVRDKLVSKLREQQAALATQLREILKLLKLCPHENRLIRDQI